MAKSVYEWSEGARVNLRAQIVGERFEEIKKRNRGVITPTAVVDDARSKTSPLHNFFEWDDRKAGKKYREEQAGYLIRHVVIRVVETPGRSGGAKATETRSSVRAFVKVVTAEKRGFVAIAEAMNDDEMRRQVLQQAWVELKGWQARYREYRELSDVFTAIDRVQGELKLAS